MQDEAELRLELLHMAFDLLMTHGRAFDPQEALDVADIFSLYVCLGSRQADYQQPTVN